MTGDVQKVKLAVTVSGRAGMRMKDAAQRKSGEWGVPFVDRSAHDSIEHLTRHYADAFLVLGGRGWRLQNATADFGFSPGMAQVRVKRINFDQPKDDVMIRLADLNAGDVVVDATVGLAVDALVCARVVGPQGRVIGIEGSLPIWALVSEGLGGKPRFENSCAIELLFGEATARLAEMPPASADCVLLDPMFSHPAQGSGTFELLRQFAVEEPLSTTLIAAARRVARRWVLVKSGSHGKELLRAGLTPVRQKRSSPVSWARVGPSVEP